MFQDIMASPFVKGELPINTGKKVDKQQRQLQNKPNPLEKETNAPSSFDVTPAAEVGATSEQSDVSTADQEVQNEDAANKIENQLKSLNLTFHALFKVIGKMDQNVTWLGSIEQVDGKNILVPSSG